MGKKPLYKSASNGQIALNGSDQILLRTDEIVLDNLILFMDASNTISFKGEPVTNNIATWMDGTFTGWSTWSAEGGSGYYTVMSEPLFGYVVQFSNTGDTGRYSLSYSETLTPSAKRTISFYVKVISAKDSNSYLNIYCDYYGGGGPYYQTGVRFYLQNKTLTNLNYVENTFCTDVGNGWYRIGFTTTFTDATSGGIYPWLIDNSVVALGHPQLEIKNYVTPFVNGTRGTTVANGGGWADLSGNGNHGTVNSNITATTDNWGGIICDGTDDYINCGTQSSLNLSTDGTLSVWAKIMDYETNLYWALAGKGASAGFDTNGYTMWYYNDNVSTNVGTLYGSVANRSPVEHLYGQSNFGTNVELGNTIHNFTLTWDTSYVKTYLDGVYVNQSSYTYGAGDTSSTEFWVGRMYTYCNCYVYNILVYNVALTGTQVANNFKAQKSQFGL